MLLDTSIIHNWHIYYVTVAHASVQDIHSAYYTDVIKINMRLAIDSPMMDDIIYQVNYMQFLGKHNTR